MCYSCANLVKLERILPCSNFFARVKHCNTLNFDKAAGGYSLPQPYANVVLGSCM